MTDEELNYDQKVEKSREILSEFRSGMLVSLMDGRPHARPMAIFEVDDDGIINFVTALSSPKVDEIARDPHVVLALQSDKAFLTASGIARIVTDLHEKRRVWELGAQVWFDGPEDPEAALIQLRPETIEYWDHRGMNSVRFFFKAVRAVATGELPAEDSREHARVNV